jgi:hypothetical protein
MFLVFFFRLKSGIIMHVEKICQLENQIQCSFIEGASGPLMDAKGSSWFDRF